MIEIMGEQIKEVESMKDDTVLKCVTIGMATVIAAVAIIIDGAVGNAIGFSIGAGIPTVIAYEFGAKKGKEGCA